MGVVAVADRRTVDNGGPSQHFSGRGLHDRNATLWLSMTIRSSRHAVFFSGDTGLTTEYEAIRERLGPFNLVMLEVGGFHPSWVTSTLGRRKRSKRSPCWVEAPSCRCTGGRSRWRCTIGTSPQRYSWHWVKMGAELLMPCLGEPVEPVQARELVPWWRAADTDARKGPAQGPVLTFPDSVPWPLD